MWFKTFILLVVSLFFSFQLCATEQQPFVIIDSEHNYNLNPHTASYSSEAQVLTGLYEGLFSYNPKTLEPLPALLSNYKVSRNKLRWTFTVLENACFSNGEKITAQSIKDSWMNLLHPKTQAPFASLLDCVKGVYEYRTGKGSAEDVGIYVQNENRIMLVLNTPAEHLPNILCHHAFAAVHPDANVYSGPFVLESYQNGILKLQKNPLYHDEKNVALQEIHIVQSDNVDENTYLFNIGSVDWIISMANLDSVLDRDSILISPEFATEYLFFKADKFPWNRADFRNALISAVPWEELRKQAFVPAHNFIYPLNDYFSPIGITDWDMEEAKIMLNEAKKAANLDVSEKVEITIAISDSEYMMNQAEILKNSWEQIGVAVNISKTPISRYLDSIEGWNADLFSYTWIGDFADPLSFLELFRSSSTMNESKWVNQEYDSLLDQASKKEGRERMDLLAQAEDILLSDGIVLPISHPVTLNILNMDVVKGWYSNALDIHPMKYFSREKEKSVIPNIVRK